MSDLHTPNPGANIVAILHTGLGGYRVKKAKGKEKPSARGRDRERGKEKQTEIQTDGERQGGRERVWERDKKI